MVEQSARLDLIFSSLADPTRRDILRRVSKKELSVGEIAAPYELTFAAVSKHLHVLEHAQLVTKKRRGREQVVRASPAALGEAERCLERYRKVWEGRLDRLAVFLKD